MKKTRQKLSEYWDNIIAKIIPPHNKFSKAEDELKEHFDFVTWIFKMLILPLIIFYVVMGVISNMNVFGSLFLSLLVFIYSNFLPDTDFLIKKTNIGRQESLWYEKYFLLFFAPIIAYYTIAGRARPLYSLENRCFHNFKTIFIYGAFLFVVGTIFWPETLKRVMLPVFGMAGFALHLAVDRGLHHLIRSKKKGSHSK